MVEVITEQLIFLGCTGSCVWYCLIITQKSGLRVWAIITIFLKYVVTVQNGERHSHVPSGYNTLRTAETGNRKAVEIWLHPWYL